MKKPEAKKPSAAPWMPSAYELADASAVQALIRGEADGQQQQRALDWIVNVASATYDMSFRPGRDGERDTAFAEGRRFVGNSIVKLSKLNLSLLARKENG